jgi:hypothetical protein
LCENGDIKSKLEDLEINIDEINSDIKQKNEDLDKKYHEINDLTDINKKLEYEIENKKLEITEIKNENDAHLKNIEQQQTEIDKLTMELEQNLVQDNLRKGAIKFLESKLEESDAKFELMRKDFDNKKAEYIANKNYVDKLQEEDKKLRNEIKLYHDDVIKLNQDYYDLLEIKKNTENEKLVRNEVIKAMKDKINKLEMVEIQKTNETQELISKLHKIESDVYKREQFVEYLEEDCKAKEKLTKAQQKQIDELIKKSDEVNMLNYLEKHKEEEYKKKIDDMKNEHSNRLFNLNETYEIRFKKLDEQNDCYRWALFALIKIVSNFENKKILDEYRLKLNGYLDEIGIANLTSRANNCLDNIDLFFVKIAKEKSEESSLKQFLYDQITEISSANDNLKNKLLEEKNKNFDFLMTIKKEMESNNKSRFSFSDFLASSTKKIPEFYDYDASDVKDFNLTGYKDSSKKSIVSSDNKFKSAFKKVAISSHDAYTNSKYYSSKKKSFVSDNKKQPNDVIKKKIMDPSLMLDRTYKKYPIIQEYDDFDYYEQHNPYNKSSSKNDTLDYKYKINYNDFGLSNESSYNKSDQNKYSFKNEAKYFNYEKIGMSDFKDRDPKEIGYYKEDEYNKYKNSDDFRHYKREDDYIHKFDKEDDESELNKQHYKPNFSKLKELNVIGQKQLSAKAKDINEFHVYDDEPKNINISKNIKSIDFKFNFGIKKKNIFENINDFDPHEKIDMDNAFDFRNIKSKKEKKLEIIKKYRHDAPENIKNENLDFKIIKFVKSDTGIRHIRYSFNFFGAREIINVNNFEELWDSNNIPPIFKNKDVEIIDI